MSVQDTLRSTLADLKPRRFTVAMFAIGTLVLCAFLMNALGHGQTHEHTPTAASTIHLEAAAGNHSALIAAGHGPEAPVAHSGGISETADACGASCAGHDATQIACLLAFLTTLVVFALFLTRLLTTNDRLRERAIDTLVSARAGPRPMTPSLQELCISRT